MESDLRQQLPDSPSDLDHRKPQSVQLHPPRRATLHELPPQGVHLPVGASVHQQAKLVGYEPMAAEAIRLEVKFEVLDPVFALVEAISLPSGLNATSFTESVWPASWLATWYG
jgi:hypothetical protein